MQDTNSWPYVVYPQLVKKKLSLKSVEYRVVNDGFIFSFIRFIEVGYTKWMSVEAATRITKVGAYYIYFKIFIYLWVDVTLLYPKKLPRYPSD